MYSESSFFVVVASIDQFESFLSAAGKPQFELEEVRIDKILVVTNPDRAAHDATLIALSSRDRYSYVDS